LLLSKERHLKVIDFGTADITNSDLVSESFKDKISHMKPKKKENDY
jgi:alpha-D-ribose 1-methylphosphonate 5-phosphate C-P lyase